MSETPVLPRLETKIKFRTFSITRSTTNPKWKWKKNDKYYIISSSPLTFLSFFIFLAYSDPI